MTTQSAASVYQSAVDRLVAEAGADPRIRALWLEGLAMGDLRRPYRRLQIHLAADEPDFAAVLADLERLAAGPAGLTRVRWSNVPRFARQLEGLLDGFPITVVLEKTSLLAKRPRSALVSLVDKTGHLCHVMDFSRTQP